MGSISWFLCAPAAPCSHHTVNSTVNLWSHHCAHHIWHKTHPYKGFPAWVNTGRGLPQEDGHRTPPVPLAMLSVFPSGVLRTPSLFDIAFNKNRARGD